MAHGNYLVRLTIRGKKQGKWPELEINQQEYKFNQSKKCDCKLNKEIALLQNKIKKKNYMQQTPKLQHKVLIAYSANGATRPQVPDNERRDGYI